MLAAARLRSAESLALPCCTAESARYV